MPGFFLKFKKDKSTDEKPLPEGQAPALENEGLSAFTTEILNAFLASGTRALFLDPEEEDVFIYHLTDTGLVEKGAKERSSYAGILKDLKRISGKNLKIEEKIIKVQVFSSLTDQGERLAIQLYDNSISEEEIKEKKKENIRLINRFKPATSLTRKNSEHLFEIWQKYHKIISESFCNFLLSEKLITEEKMKEIIDCKAGEGEPAEKKLILNGVYPRKQFTKAFACWLKVSFIDPEEIKPSGSIVKILPEEKLISLKILPFNIEETEVFVALIDPLDEDKIKEIEDLLGKKVVPFMAPEEDIRIVLEDILRKEV